MEYDILRDEIAKKMAKASFEQTYPDGNFDEITNPLLETYIKNCTPAAEVALELAAEKVAVVQNQNNQCTCKACMGSKENYIVYLGLKKKP